MEQLEMRFYNLDELSEIAGINRKSKNFKRDVENILDNWGYGHVWINRMGATINYIPTTQEEILQEILVRKFHVNIQVDMYHFACFIVAFADNEDGFISMPWDEREEYLKKYGFLVTNRTLRRWCKRLIDQEIISKGASGSIWKTEMDKENRFVKIRTLIPEGSDEIETYKAYQKRRQELKNQLDNETQCILRNHQDKTYREAKQHAWNNLYSTLWSEYGCCYYECKSFNLLAWNSNGELAEVIELAKDITERRRKQ